MPDRGAFPGQSIADCPVFLSDRQREVLRLAALGYSAVGIARQLVISVYTVNEHLAAARRALRAQNTTHACTIAVVTGLIEFSAMDVQRQG